EVDRPPKPEVRGGRGGLMRTVALTALLVPGLAAAQDRPDAQVEWLEPTCDHGSLKASVKARSTSACGIARPERITWQVVPSTSPLGCRVWVHAWCPDGPHPGYVPPGPVVLPTIFQDADYKGLALSLDVGPWNLRDVP